MWLSEARPHFGFFCIGHIGQNKENWAFLAQSKIGYFGYIFMPILQVKRWAYWAKKYQKTNLGIFGLRQNWAFLAYFHVIFSSRTLGILGILGIFDPIGNIEFGHSKMIYQKVGIGYFLRFFLPGILGMLGIPPIMGMGMLCICCIEAI